MAVLEKQARALELRTAGASFDAIASELGYADRSAAWRLVNNALRTSVNERVDEYRDLQEARWEALLAAFWFAATAELDGAAARVVQRALQGLDALWGFNREVGGARPTEPSEPWGIVMYASEEEWVAAGSPRA